uniref:Uncharacterized protein n=1 Tax=Anguilla anguilla TaxID=7936 RepID=A0A0E9UXB6_ANGAN
MQQAKLAYTKQALQYKTKVLHI